MTEINPSFLLIAGTADLQNITHPKEGQKNGDGSVGLAMKFSTYVACEQAALMMAQRPLADELCAMWWDKDGAPYWVGVNSPFKVGTEFKGSYFAAFDLPEVEAKLNKISLKPLPQPGSFEAGFNVYISQPSHDLVLEAIEHVGSEVTIKFEQRQIELTSDEDSE